MRATERYERAWNAFQIHLNHNPKASLIPFLKERHVNHRSMHRWMSEKGYSVRLAKQQIRLLQAEARKECSEAIAKDTGMMFLPMEMPSEPVCPENYLFGITLTFPNGTIVTIKKGSVKSVMHLMKLYERRICYVWTKRKYPVLRLPAICPNEHGHKRFVSDCENRDGTSATWWCGIHLLLQEPPAGKIAQMGWRWFLAVTEATGARNL